MRSASASRSTGKPTIFRSGIALDPKLVAAFRVVAARTDIAQRVLTILEPGQGPKSPVAADRHGRELVVNPPPMSARPTDLECDRRYRKSGASQRGGEYRPNELADNPTSPGTTQSTLLRRHSLRHCQADHAAVDCQ
jgi:hypothetical protein